ncbi:hypothetical protein, partial [Sphingomonas sp. T9W2]|uniref:hypothetical protein n=1 Tax=Sphingomonas sp. T9W2 TaxID=3143183 RepID=UPI0031F53B81
PDIDGYAVRGNTRLTGRLHGFHIDEARLRPWVTYLSSFTTGSRLLGAWIAKPHSIVTGSNGRLPGDDHRTPRRTEGSSSR